MNQLKKINTFVIIYYLYLYSLLVIFVLILLIDFEIYELIMIIDLEFQSMLLVALTDDHLLNCLIILLIKIYFYYEIELILRLTFFENFIRNYEIIIVKSIYKY